MTDDLLEEEFPMPTEEVAQIRDQWSGSVYEGAIVRLCDSHERLRRLVESHDAMREEGQCPSPIGCYE